MRTLRLLLALALATLIMSPTTAAFAADNLPPVAQDDSYTVAEGQTLSVGASGVLGNDSDPEGGQLTVTDVGGSSNAETLSIHPNGALEYKAKAGFTGTDTITYAAKDDSGNKSLATVSIDVTANLAPVAVDDSYGMTEGHTLNDPTPGVLGNDSDPEGDHFTVTDFSGGAHGVRSILSGGSLSYTPDPGFTGVDTLTYTITDDFGGTSTATVTIYVNANQPPVANDDEYSIVAGDTLSVDAPGVLANDDEYDAEQLTVTDVGGSANAETLSILPNGALEYTPNVDFTGTDTITYAAKDEFGLKSTATITIHVNANQNPTANDDSYSVGQGGTLTIAAPGVLENDTDPDGGTLTVADFTSSTNASGMNIAPDGTLTYTPKPDFTGDDTIPYIVDDGQGGDSTATITIHVTPAPVTPLVVDDHYSVDEGDTLSVDAPGVLGNDTLPSGSSLGSCTDATHGTVTCHADGSLTFVPAEGFSGDASFVYSVDGPVVPSSVRAAALAANEGLVTIHVTADDTSTPTDDPGTSDDPDTLPDTGNAVPPSLPVLGAFLILAGLMVLRTSRRLF